MAVSDSIAVADFLSRRMIFCARIPKSGWNFVERKRARIKFYSMDLSFVRRMNTDWKHVPFRHGNKQLIQISWHNLRISVL
jgi:hypothetical protein